MKNTKIISVCMTVFSYSKFLDEQLNSIVNQTEKIDELVIVEDYSGEKSPKDYIERICMEKQIQLLYKTSKKNKGPAECFREAILLTNGSIIFLSDHDDIWSKDRIKRALYAHNEYDFVIVNGNKLISPSSSCSIKNDENPIYDNLSFSILGLILKNKIIGATISIDGKTARYLAERISFYPMHDWVLIISFLILKKRISFLNESLIMYRRHDGTFTDNRKNSFLKKIKFRLSIFFRIIKLFMIK